MSITENAPALLACRVRFEKKVSVLTDDYAQSVESSAGHVVNSGLKKTLRRDQRYRKWREQRPTSAAEKPGVMPDGGNR
jgi:hypothetical protein